MSKKMKHSNITVSSGKLQFAELIKAHFYTPFGVPCEHPLPLPLGEARDARTVHRKVYRSAPLNRLDKFYVKS